MDLQRAQLLFGLGNQFRDVQQQQAYDPIQRYQSILGITNAGLGPYGTQTSSSGGQSGSQFQSGTETGSYGGTYTQPKPPKNILGGAVAGAQAGSAFGPWGAGIGAVIGGASSALSRQRAGAVPQQIMQQPGGGMVMSVGPVPGGYVPPGGPTDMTMPVNVPVGGPVGPGDIMAQPPYGGGFPAQGGAQGGLAGLIQQIQGGQGFPAQGGAPGGLAGLLSRFNQGAQVDPSQYAMLSGMGGLLKGLR
jgi:hypothetical protein